MEVVAKFEGGDEITDAIKEMIRMAPEKTAKVMFTSAHAVLIPAIKQKIKANSSVFRGDLLRVAARIKVEEFTPTIEVGSLGVPYGTIVEKGSGPRHITKREKEKIVEYCRKKMKMDLKRAKRVAGGIVHTLMTVGNKAHPYLVPTWEATKTQYWKDFSDRMVAS